MADGGFCRAGRRSTALQPVKARSPPGTSAISGVEDATIVPRRQKAGNRGNGTLTEAPTITPAGPWFCLAAN